MMKKTDSIWVRNNSDQTFTNRYDGEDISIKPGAALEIEVSAATLIFGFGEDDKTRCLRRLGWAFSHDKMAEANERLGKFSFHMNQSQALALPSAPGHSSAPVGGDNGAVVASVTTAPKAPAKKNPAKKKVPYKKPVIRMPPLEKLAAQAG